MIACDLLLKMKGSVNRYGIPLTLILFTHFLAGCHENDRSAGSSGTEPFPGYAIAYNVLTDTEADNYEVFTMNMDGSGKRNVSQLNGVEWTYLSHADRLYFISDKDTCRRCYFLYRTDHLGRDPVRVSDIRLADSWMSAVPDGSRLIVRPHASVDSAFYIIGRSGELLRKLYVGMPFLSDPLFMDSGKQVVFRGGTRKSKREADYREELYVIGIDGTGRRQLTQYPPSDTTAPWYAYKAGPPKYQPAEDFISYHSYRDGKYSLYAVTPDGSRQWKLTDLAESEGWHAWSPDGNWLAIELFDDAQTQFHIGLMEWRTKAVTILTDTAYVYQQAPNFVVKAPD